MGRARFGCGQAALFYWVTVLPDTHSLHAATRAEEAGGSTALVLNSHSPEVIRVISPHFDPKAPNQAHIRPGNTGRTRNPGGTGLPGHHDTIESNRPEI